MVMAKQLITIQPFVMMETQSLEMDEMEIDLLNLAGNAQNLVILHPILALKSEEMASLYIWLEMMETLSVEMAEVQLEPLNQDSLALEEQALIEANESKYEEMERIMAATIEMMETYLIMMVEAASESMKNVGPVSAEHLLL